MAEPRAMIHVVGLHHDAAELLDDVAVLVGGFGAGEGAEASVALREPLGRSVQRLVPADLDPVPVAADHRARDPVARVDEARAEAPLDAQHAEARLVRRHVVGHHGEVAVVAHVHADAAADPTVRARRLDASRDLGGHLFWPPRARPARRHTLAARGADRRGYRAVAEDTDP